MAIPVNRVSIGVEPFERKMSVTVQSYKQYRANQLGNVSLEGLSGYVRSLKTFSIASSILLSLVDLCVELAADYVKSVGKTDVKVQLLKYCRHEGQVDSILLVTYDALAQINDFVDRRGDENSFSNEDLEEIHRLVLLMKGSIATVLSTIEGSVRMSKEDVAAPLEALLEQWQTFTETMGSLPVMQSIAREAVAKSLRRGIQTIDSVLSGGGQAEASSRRGVSNEQWIPFLFPPFTCCGDGPSGLVHRSELMTSALLSLSWTKRRAQGGAAASDAASQAPPPSQAPGRRSVAAAVAAAVAAEMSGVNRRSSQATGLWGGAQVSVLYGGPGVGKSTLALCLVQQVLGLGHADASTSSEEVSVGAGAEAESEACSGGYDLVRWMHMSPGCIHSEWVLLAQALGLGLEGWQRGGHDAPLETIVGAVYTALSKYNYLLVFDSVEGVESIRSSLPSSAARRTDKLGDVVITTRSSTGWGLLGYPALQVGTFSAFESQDFLLGRLGVAHRELAQQDEELIALVSSVHTCFSNLPLCLSLAASCIQACRKVFDTFTSAGNKYTLGLFLGQLKDRGVPVSNELAMTAVDGSREATNAHCKKTSVSRVRRRSVHSALASSFWGSREELSAAGREQEVSPTALAMAAVLDMMLADLEGERLRLLGFMCLVGSDEIPRALLLRLCEDEACAGLTEEEEDARLSVLLQPLLDRFLLRPQNDAITRFYIHPLLQATLCEAIVGIDRSGNGVDGSNRLLLTRGAYERVLREWMQPLVKAMDGLCAVNAGHVDRLAVLGVHCEEVMVLLERLGETSISEGPAEGLGETVDLGLLQSQLLMRQGESWCAQLRYRESLVVFQKRLTLLGSRSGGGADQNIDKGIADTLLAIGNVYRLQRCLDEALTMCSDACQIMSSLLIGSAEERPEGHLDLARAFKAVGQVYSDQKKLGDAVDALDKALSQQRLGYATFIPSPCDPHEAEREVASTLRSIGDLYKAQGSYADTMTYYLEALELDRALQAAGEQSDFEVAKALNNIGNIHYRTNNFDEALKCYLESLSLSRLLHETDMQQEDVARTLYNIGNTYFCLDRHQEALEHLQEALHIADSHRHSFGLDEVARVLNNIGNVYKALGQFEEAVSVCTRSLQLKREFFAGNASGSSYHPELCKTLQNLGSAYTSQGNYDDALRVFNEALSMKRLAFPEDHYEIDCIRAVIERTGMLEAYRNDIQSSFRKYVIDRAASRKPGFPYSKLDKINAAKFVLEYVARPQFRQLVDIHAEEDFESHKGPLLHGALGEIFRKYCEVSDK